MHRFYACSMYFILQCLPWIFLAYHRYAYDCRNCLRHRRFSLSLRNQNETDKTRKSVFHYSDSAQRFVYYDIYCNVHRAHYRHRTNAHLSKNQLIYGCFPAAFLSAFKTGFERQKTTRFAR